MTGKSSPLNDEERGEMYTQYLKLIAAMRVAFGEKNKLLQELDRAPAARAATPQNARAYLVMNPTPLAPEELDEEAFARLVERAGPDFWRLRAVDPKFVASDTHPLVVGGSCAVETWAMGVLGWIDRIAPGRKAEYAERLLAMAPTVTHATGAMLTGQDFSVHYWEDRLWSQRLEAYGVPDALAKTTAAYERIQGAMERRARLINPRTTVAVVNFDELRLDEGPLQEWFEQIGVPFDPNFGIANVIYTYAGPRMLELTKRALAGRPEVAHLVNGQTHHVRLKQIDHNDWDATLAEFKPVILGAEPKGKIAELLDGSYPFRAGVAISRWVREANSNGLRSVASGFFDMPFGDHVMHMLPNVGGRYNGTIEALDELLASPVRLWHGNLPEHMAYLSTYLEEEVRGASEEMAGICHAIAECSKKVARLGDRVKKKRNRIPMLEVLCVLMGRFIEGTELNQQAGSPVPEALDELEARLGKMRTNFEGKQALSELDQADLAGAIDTLTVISSLRTGSRAQLSDSGRTLLTKLATEYRQEIVMLRDDQLPQNEAEHAAASAELERLRSMQRAKAAAEGTRGTVYPLKENMVVLHATQFLWDPDFRAFLLMVAEIDGRDMSKEDKIGAIKREIARILPKLEAYLKYIFLGGEYPLATRETRLY